MLSKRELVKVFTSMDKFVEEIDWLWREEPLDKEETGQIAGNLKARLDDENGN